MGGAVVKVAQAVGLEEKEEEKQAVSSLPLRALQLHYRDCLC